jgi:prolyl 4-hydroxylase
MKPKSNEVVCSMHVAAGTSVYYCNPFEETDTNEPSNGIFSGEICSLDTLSDEDRRLYDAAVFNREFAGLYKDFTGGSEWLGHYPTQPPKHWMWRADYFGQEFSVQSEETQFKEIPPAENLKHLSIVDMKGSQTDPLPFSEYREPGVMNITIKAVSCAPRVFQIENFLSDAEVDHILEMAIHKNLQRSTTGESAGDAIMSDVRTSRTTWLARNSSPVINAIIRRAADVLKIDEAFLRHRTTDEYPDYPTRNAINEDLQIVHYSQSQQYTPHHDFGYPDSRPNGPSRSINLCIYLNEGMMGGQTEFPRWRNAETSKGMKATPKKGKAMIFYMKNPDGNLDDLSQHAALPVIEGEKWFLNLWTWDPVRD